jgi:anti-anti-sigma factor
VSTREKTVLPLPGELCIADVDDIRRRIDGAIEGGVRDLILDLTETTLLTAAALRVFNITEHRLQTMGGTLTVRNPAPLPRRVLELTGFGGLIEPAPAG